jgi:hypothetical protein
MKWQKRSFQQPLGRKNQPSIESSIWHPEMMALSLGGKTIHLPPSWILPLLVSLLPLSFSDRFHSHTLSSNRAKALDQSSLPIPNVLGHNESRSFLLKVSE